MQTKFTNALMAFGLALSGCVTTPAVPPVDKSLVEAAKSGNLSDVAVALDHGAQIDRLDGPWSALIWAAKNGHNEVAKFLLDRGARVDLPSPLPEGVGLTPLCFAAMRKDEPMVNLLIAKGADAQAAIDGLERLISRNAPYRYRYRANLKMSNEAESGIKMLEKRQVQQAAAPTPPTVRLAVNTLETLSPNYSSPASADDYAVIVGIEKYPDLPAANYAERDATAVKNFIQALGVPERNVVFLTGSRATGKGLEKTIEGWLPNNVSKISRVYFYYSGHGAPDTKTGDAYLVPSDGDPQYLAQTGYPLKRLYAKLGQLKAKSVLVALDSCFSGAGGRSVLAKGTRPLVGKVDMAVEAESKVSVISASAGDQISGSNEDAGYGLFTYNFLQGLNGAAKNSQGQVTLQSLYGYLKPRVQDDARRGNRDQTPQLQIGGEDLLLRAK